MTAKKLIILLDNGEPIPLIIRQLGKNRVWYMDTKNVEPEKEYDFINSSIDRFMLTNKDALLVKFSGNENVARKIGDEREEMVLHPSSAEKDKHYIEEYTNTLNQFINIFYEETNIC